MPDDIRWEWLDRYFSGECTPEEVREIQRWIAEAPERQGLVDDLREIWVSGARQPEGRWNAQAAWRRFARTLDAPGAAAPRPRLTVIPAARLTETTSRLPRRIAYALRVAAAIAILVGGAGIWQLVVRTGDPSTAQTVALRDFTTPKGQRATVTLGDGTKIMLGPASTLRAARDFGEGAHRDVYLDGEAFFEVTHDAKRPFTVHGTHGVAEDLGTQFVVRSYAGDSTMRVVVAEGVVAIRGRRDSTAPGPTAQEVLRAGDLGTVSQGGGISMAHHVALDEYVGWTTGQLVFRNAPLREVVTALARWYDVDIDVTGGLADTRRVTLTTEPSQPLTEVLTALTIPLGLKARWSGRTVVIRP